MNLLLIDSEELSPSGGVTLAGVRAGHLLRVLKATPGQQVRIGVVDGPLGVGTVERVGEATVVLRCALDAEVPPRPRVDLLLALPRPKVMRRLWAQVAAIGVGQIILTNAERVERNYFDTSVLAPERYRPLLLEGLQQARDTRLPSVTIHRQFKVLVEDDLDRLFPGRTRFVAHPGAARSVGDVPRESSRGDDERMLLAIGPEGGWNTFELDLLAAHGFSAVNMGPRTLRTDTACVAMLSLAHNAFRPNASH